ncbi:hypothetical protein INT48_003310 [Thamnidium elegans]|uniref:WRKY domain-containing protein n=1 Tax=Thamnidium elegans TaxID=101142 RepID=A0A8H7SJE4_9FUNG|nr:hypothetical protein INT48_003310 [Thamnidium elegans]
MLTSNSLLLSSNNKDYYPPSPPLSSILDSKMNKTSLLSNTWCPPKLSPPPAESSAFLNLEKVVQTYGSQPELLELILSSKVEEDRRRAEEAKLRRKEIDYMLQQQQQPKKQKERTNKITSLPPISSSNQYGQRVNSFSSTNSVGSVESSPLPRLQYRTKYSSPHFFNKSNKSPNRRNSSNIEMLLIPSPKSLELKLPELSMTPSTSSYNNRSRSSSFVGESEDDETFAAGSASSSTESYKIKSTVHKRRRREMQAITTIIETREFPYNDDYLWKNNGNTVHKKTGFKSIYYKCSNSSKGCPVNKTVTFKDNGEHLIKYRGQHLTECNRIKRITDL